MSNLRPCERDQRVLTTPDVIHASNIAVKPGMLPHRIVLRDVSRGRQEYVVHTERLETRSPSPGDSCAFVHHSFDHGDYTSNLERALEFLRERSARL